MSEGVACCGRHRVPIGPDSPQLHPHRLRLRAAVSDFFTDKTPPLTARGGRLPYRLLFVVV